MHFRTELSCEKDLNDEYRGIIESLDQLYQDVGRQIGDLESSLKQIDKYQHEVQLLKQKLVQEEQLLKTMAAEQSADNVQVRVCFYTVPPFIASYLSHHQQISQLSQKKKYLKSLKGEIIR